MVRIAASGGFSTKSWKRITALSSLFPDLRRPRFAVWLLLMGVIFLGGCAQPPEDSAFLAKVGEDRITAGDLRAFISGRPSSPLTPEETRNHLQTMIDRRILLEEARAQGLEEDRQVSDRPDQEKKRTLYDEMMRLEVYDRVSVEEEEIEQAYQQAGWSVLVVSQEIFVSDEETAKKVVDLLENGMEFAEVARLHAVDRMMGLPSGKPDRFTYSPYDAPKAVVRRVFVLPEGGTTEPIPLRGGHVIARVRERRRVGIEEVRDKIRTYLHDLKVDILRDSYLSRLRAALDFRSHPQNMEVVVQVLKDGRSLSTLPEEQLRLPVYTFGDVVLGVEEVVEAVEPGKAQWPQINQDEVIYDLKRTLLPVEVMACDGRGRGVDQTEAFRRLLQAEKQGLMLVRLRDQVLEGRLQVTQEDLEVYYDSHKRRFRIPAQAHLQELLVEDADQARDLVRQIKAGAELSELIGQYSIRHYNVEEGVLRVFDIQNPLYGEEWMNTVMNAPLNELQGPVKTKGGYSVFKVLHRYDESFDTLENKWVRGMVVRAVKEEKERSIFNNYLEELREKYAERIKVDEEKVKRL